MFYVPAALCGVAFIVYQVSVGKVTMEGLRDYCKAAANAFSLGLIVLLLGYGLVELPRYLWNKGDVEGQLRYLYFRVTEYDDNLTLASTRLAEAFAALERMTEQIMASECVGDSAKMRRLCARVALAANASERAAVLKDTADALERLHRDPPPAPRQADLETLHSRIKDGLISYRRARALYTRTLERAIKHSDLGELLKQLDEASWDQQRNARGPAAAAQKAGLGARLRHACDQRYLRVTVEPQFWRLMALGCAGLSLLVLVCESTIIFRDIVNLSVLSWALFLDPSGGPLFLVCFTVPLLYITAAVYFGFFRMKLFNFYALHTGQNSDYASLLFNGTYMCRLAPALVYNYLNLLHEPHRTEETGVSPSYLLGLGSMDVVPFFGSDYYNDLAPIVIVLICGVTYLNLFAQIGQMCGSKTFQFDNCSDTELTEGGARIVERELRKRRGEPDAEAGVALSAAPSTAAGKRAAGAHATPDLAAVATSAAASAPARGASVSGWRARLAAPPPAMAPASNGSLHAALPERKPKARVSNKNYSQLDDSPAMGIGRDPSEQELADLASLKGLKGFGDL
jgi:hypothetical protein